MPWRCRQLCWRDGADGTVPPLAAHTNWPCVLDSGDKLRILVFAQEALSNSYAADAAGEITIRSSVRFQLSWSAPISSGATMPVHWAGWAGRR